MWRRAQKAKNVTNQPENWPCLEVEWGQPTLTCSRSHFPRRSPKRCNCWGDDLSHLSVYSHSHLCATCTHFTSSSSIVDVNSGVDRSSSLFWLCILSNLRFGRCYNHWVERLDHVHKQKFYFQVLFRESADANGLALFVKSLLWTCGFPYILCLDVFTKDVTRTYFISWDVSPFSFLSSFLSTLPYLFASVFCFLCLSGKKLPQIPLEPKEQCKLA